MAGRWQASIVAGGTIALAAALIVALSAGPGRAEDESLYANWGGAPESFRWFSSLGYPDVAQAPLVLVTRVRPVVHDRPEREYGFLLHDAVDRFSILTSSLQTPHRPRPLSSRSDPVYGKPRPLLRDPEKRLAPRARRGGTAAAGSGEPRAG